tara:strand:+ start:341 stop:781 length:441 start_codon:yes stop_codon:yes gene_type:complete
MNFGTSYFETQFIQECGSKAAGFDTLTSLGKQKSILPQVFTLIVFIGMIISLTIGYGTLKDKNGEKMDKSTKTIFKVLFWLLLLGFLPLSGFTIYRYIIFWKQYSQWFSSLSLDCQMKLQAINSIESALTALNNNNNNNNNYNYKY